jgi:hypothetical protein
MSRLPVPGSDIGTWGDILNDFLNTAHLSDGSLKADTVGSGQIQVGAINASKIAAGIVTEAHLDADVQQKLNATAGTPDWSTIVNKPVVIAAGADATAAKATLSLSKADVGLGNVDNTSDASKPISNSTQTALNNKANLVHTHTATQISDSTATGRSILTAADAATAKSALSLSKSDVGLGNVDNTSDLNKPTSSATQTALDAKADLVGGLVPTAQLPALAYNTAVTVANQSAMLALTSAQVQPGDLAIRQDGAGTFILTGSDPSQLSNWTLLDSPTAPVTSVNSQTGTVVLGKADVGLGNIDNTSDLNKPISSATQTALNAKADLVGGVIPSAQLPSLALTNVVTVASQAAMLALTTTQVQPGDIAIRTDGAGSFILVASDPSQLSNWTLLATPTDTVTSVNSQTGAVVLTKSDINLGNVDNTSDATKNSAVATLTNKWIQPRTTSPAISSSYTINTDNVDIYNVSGQNAAVTFNNPTGTPVMGQQLLLVIKDNGTARTITWGTNFQSSGVATLLATTVVSKTHWIGLTYDSNSSKWVCLAVDATGY